MKINIRIISNLSLALLLSLNYSCKKDNDPPTTSPTPNNNCNYTSNVLAVDATTKSILSDSCRVFGDKYYTEHFADAGRTEAVTIIFDGTSAPSPGNYTAVNSFAAISSSQVYVEYYTAADAFQPASGTVTVADSGTSKIYSFCNLTCTNGTATKTISLRNVCN